MQLTQTINPHLASFPALEDLRRPTHREQGYSTRSTPMPSPPAQHMYHIYPEAHLHIPPHSGVPLLPPRNLARCDQGRPSSGGPRNIPGGLRPGGLRNTLGLGGLSSAGPRNIPHLPRGAGGAGRVGTDGSGEAGLPSEVGVPAASVCWISKNIQYYDVTYWVACTFENKDS